MKKIVIFLFILLLMPVMVQAKLKINSTLYDTLEDAASNVKEGETIQLLDDVDVSDTTKYGAYHNWLFPDHVVLDLNGHTITTSEVNSAPNAVWLGNYLTIKNGFFNSSIKKKNSDEPFEANYALFLGDEIETSYITLENVTVSTGINIYNTLNTTLKNVVATGKEYYAVWLDAHTTVTIESGTYKSNGISVLGITSTDDFTNELTIMGGTFQAEKGKLSLSEGGNPKYLAPIIKGGTFNFDVTEFIADGYVCNENNNNFIVENKNAISNPTTSTSKTVIHDILVDSSNDLNITIADENILQILTTSLPANVFQGKDIDIQFDLKKLENIQDIANLMQQKTSAIIANYFDISIHVLDKYTKQTLGTLTELQNKITLSLPIPDSLKSHDGFHRVFYILREHNGNIDILEPSLSEDKQSLVFETDLFSTYALAYKDIETNETVNPSTYDNISFYVMLGGISLFVLGAGSLMMKKKIIK